MKTTRLLLRINRNNDMYTLNNKLWDMFSSETSSPFGRGSRSGNEHPWKVEMGR